MRSGSLPALVIFLPQNILVIAIFAALAWLISFDSMGKRLPLNQSFKFSPAARKVYADLEKAAGLHYLPAMACIAILSEILMLEAVYYYTEEGWFEGLLTVMAEAWLERRTDYYWATFGEMVLGQHNSAAALQ